MPLSIPFENQLPDWNLRAEYYPRIFIVDERWTHHPNDSFRIGSGSIIRNELTGCRPLMDGNEDLYNENRVYIHGEKTLYIIKKIVQNLPDDNVTLVSARRVIDEEFDSVLPPFNLPEALLSIQMQLKPGDLVVINLQDYDDNSFADDELVAFYLKQIADTPQQGGFGGLVVISAGNKSTTQPLPESLAPGAVIVGAVNANGQPLSRFGPGVTCYEVTPYKVSVPPTPDCPFGYDIEFSNSSAATAYIAGMVLVMLNHANAKGQPLTGEQVVDLLKNNGLKSESSKSILGDLGSLPDWSTILS